MQPYLHQIHNVYIEKNIHFPIMSRTLLSSCSLIELSYLTWPFFNYFQEQNFTVRAFLVCFRSQEVSFSRKCQHSENSGTLTSPNHWSFMCGLGPDMAKPFQLVRCISSNQSFPKFIEVLLQMSGNSFEQNIAL